MGALIKVTTEYLQEVFVPTKFPATVHKAARVIEAYGPPCDAIAFTGVSGAALGFPLAMLLNKPMICVRKDNDSSHSLCAIEGVIEGRYIIVDDFIETGETIRRIERTIMRENRSCRLVGIYLYGPQIPHTDRYNDYLIEER